MYSSKIEKSKLLLDVYEYTPYCAFSLRRLTKKYNGPCLNVRNETSGTTADIYFSSDGIIDYNQLADFCGTSNGRITKWYDQMGNADGTPATNALQPFIWPSTSYWKDKKGSVAMRFFEGQNEISMPRSFFKATNFAVSIVAAPFSLVGNSYNCIGTDGTGFNGVGTYLQSNTTGNIHRFNRAGASTPVAVSVIAGGIEAEKAAPIILKYRSDNYAKIITNTGESDYTQIVNYTDPGNVYKLGSYYAGASRATSICLNGYVSEYIAWRDTVIDEYRLADLQKKYWNNP